MNLHTVITKYIVAFTILQNTVVLSTVEFYAWCFKNCSFQKP